MVDSYPRKEVKENPLADVRQTVSDIDANDSADTAGEVAAGMQQ